MIRLNEDMSRTKKSRMEGNIYKSNNCGDFMVTKYNTSYNVEVRFTATGYETSTQRGQILAGNVKDPFSPSLYGVGFIGKGKHKGYTKKKGKVTRAYQNWHNMLERCYNEKTQERNPTYKGCKVVADWHNYQNFADWHEVNFIEGCSLDKDLIVFGNREYSPELCSYVPPKINNLLHTRKNTGKGLAGTSYSKRHKKYRAEVYDETGRALKLGYYSNEQEAHEVYLTKKLEIVKLVAEKYVETIDKRVYNNLVNLTKEELRELTKKK